MVSVDTVFLVGDIPLIQQLLCLDAKRATARAVNFDSCHGFSLIHYEGALYKKLPPPK
jgi:hypothetical protein